LIVIFLTTLGVSLLSAVVPVVNSEIYLLGASSLSPPQAVPWIIAGAALGQMAGKSLLYFGGRGALRLPSPRLQRMVQTVEQRYASGGTAPALGATVVLVSAGVGLPPFYVTSVACGIFRIPFAQFFVVGLIGFLARFSVVVLAPQLIRAWS
jgi:membrane protein YqaA with SNARE-associated domain